MTIRETPEKNYVYSPHFPITKANVIQFSHLSFGKELSIFRPDLLSIIRRLNTVFTTTGICHTEILKMGKIAVYLHVHSFIQYSV